MAGNWTGISTKAVEAGFIKKVSEIVRTGLATYPPIGVDAQENVMRLSFELGSLALRYDKKYRNHSKNDFRCHTRGLFKDKVIKEWNEHYQQELRSAVDTYVRN